MPATPLLNAWMVEMRMLWPLVTTAELGGFCRVRRAHQHFHRCAWPRRPSAPYDLPEGIDQGIEQRARNLNDLGRGVVVLLEFDQVCGFFLDVDRGHRVAVVGRLFEDGTGRVAVLPGLGCQGADPLDQIAITVGETDPGADAH